MEPGIYSATDELIMSWEIFNFKSISKVFEGVMTMKRVYTPEYPYKIVLPDTIKLIPQNAFDSCDTLISITMPGVQVIDKKAFSGCDLLKEVILSNNLKKIKDAAFMDCTSLININLPESLKELGVSSFNNAIKLKSIKLPHNITTIPAECFCNCQELQDINLENVKELGYDCFNYCKSLKSVNLNKLETAGANVFRDCKSLEKIILNNNLRTIEYCMFYGCKSLKEIILPEQLEKIKMGSFTETDIKELVIPEHIEHIQTAFLQMPKLETVLIKGSPKTINDDNFTNCPNLKTIYISKNTYNEVKPFFKAPPSCKIKFGHTLDDLLEKRSFREANKCILEERDGSISR